MDDQEIQDLDKVSKIWVKKLTCVANKVNHNTKTEMIDTKPKDAIKLGIVKLNKSDKYSNGKMLPEDDLYRYLHLPGEQHGDKKYELLTLTGVLKRIA